MHEGLKVGTLHAPGTTSYPFMSRLHLEEETFGFRCGRTMSLGNALPWSQNCSRYGIRSKELNNTVYGRKSEAAKIYLGLRMTRNTATATIERTSERAEIGRSMHRQ